MKTIWEGKDKLLNLQSWENWLSEGKRPKFTRPTPCTKVHLKGIKNLNVWNWNVEVRE